jgi:hypothetical protein
VKLGRSRKRCARCEKGGHYFGQWPLGEAKPVDMDGELPADGIDVSLSEPDDDRVFVGVVLFAVVAMWLVVVAG